MSTSTKPFGLVLSAWFPEHESPNKPGLKYRPVIVLDVNSQTQELLVAYGTSQRTQCLGNGEFLVQKDSIEGLAKDTKFCIEYHRWIPASHCFLDKDGQRNVFGFISKRVYRKFKIAIEEVFDC